MPDDRTSRLLDEFSAVTGAAPRPGSPARRAVIRQRFPVATLSGASLVIVTIAIAAIVVGRSGPANVAGSSASASAPTASTTTSAPASAIVANPTTGPCEAANLATRITAWEGAAGQRIAHVELTNRGSNPCLLDVIARPQLLDGRGAVIIDGSSPGSVAKRTILPGAVLTTLVEAGNDCKPAPQAPVTLAFLFYDRQRVVAEPLTPTDVTVPPCNGAGSPATIDMHPWAP